MLSFIHSQFFFIQAVLFFNIKIWIVYNFLTFISVQEVQQEGKHAIDSPGSPMASTLPPEEYALGNRLSQLYTLFTK